METQDLGGIIYSNYGRINRQGEQFIGEHYVCLILCGQIRIIDGDKTTVFNEGEVTFFRKNGLAKFLKQPADQGYFKAITVMLDQKILTEFRKEQHLGTNAHVQTAAVLSCGQDKLLKTYFHSLADYFNESISNELIDYKRQELIHLLIRKDALFKSILFDFDQPGKIDLESFMRKNFKFNVGLDKFAFLTGRSLASFKRDFEKIFNTPPNRWLQQQRLNEAHYLLYEKQLKPSEVYLEVGFESPSHFSFAFKKQFGYNPAKTLSLKN